MIGDTWLMRAFPLCLFLLLAACASAPVPAPYPHESVLTVMGELKIFLNQDPYRDPPGADLQGRNIFRVSLERLANLKELTPPEYAGVLAYARGECLERMGDWRGAARAFEDADRAEDASSTQSIAASARPRAEMARRMADLTDRGVMGKTLESYLNDLEVLERKLNELLSAHPDFPIHQLIQVENERALAERVRLLADNRLVLKNAMPRAIELARRLVREHARSRRAGEHDLLLGGLFEALARDLTANTPPEGHEFSAETGWNGLLDNARGAYTRAAQRDGDAAKPEAQARVRALEAYALRIQNLAR